jgi:uvrD/REP helicase
MYIIFCKYNQELKSFNGFDFDDLILEATKIISKKSKYKHIIIDEFQDTSLIRFNLINKIRVINNATLFCVGDDYQSIYHFSGSDINLFLKFKEYISDAKVMKLKYTYRNSQELINASTSFVMKNNKQLKKDLISNKHIDKPIKFIYYINPYKAFKKLYKELNNNNLLVLGRNNFDIKKFSKDDIPEFMSVHSSKGLEADNVILINMVDDLYGFPNKLINSKLIEELHPSDKSYIYAEERRLFYVALTRTKNYVYILVPIFKKSIFIKELKKILKQLYKKNL